MVKQEINGPHMPLFDRAVQGCAAVLARRVNVCASVNQRCNLTYIAASTSDIKRAVA